MAATTCEITPEVYAQAVKQLFTIFRDVEIQDILDAAAERGVEVKDLIRQAVLDDLAR